MDLREVEHYLSGLVKGTVLRSESMKKHTTWRIGGPADIMVIPSGIGDIELCLGVARERDIPVTVMGNGSNMLVKDNGIRGIVLKVSRGFNQIEFRDTAIVTEAGALVPMVARRAFEAGLTGMEFAVGIPASVGGAVYMNAGAHGRCISDVVRKVTVLDPDGQMFNLSNQEVGFEYRKSAIKDRNLVVLKVEFSLIKGDPKQIREDMETKLSKRRKSQPLEYPNAGSVFSNPPEQWAGWLIEQAGGKGMTVGGARISEKHANFIVNTGEATAADVLTLIDRVKQLVHEKFNIELTLEVRVIGE